MIIQGLSKKYRDHVIFEDLNINFPAKGFVGITGASGVGKTTLLNLLGLLDQPDRGSIFLSDTDLVQLSIQDQNYFRREHLGFMFQDHQLIKGLTVYENIQMGFDFAGLKDKDIKSHIHELAEKLHINHLLHHFPNTLSGGEAQRVSIARALIKNPLVILADEPTGSLDEKQAASVMTILKDISKNYLVIVISHDQNLLHTYADALFELKNQTLHTLKNVPPTEMKPLHLKKPRIAPQVMIRYAYTHLIKHLFRSLFLIFILAISMIGMSLSLSFNQALNDYIIENEQKLLDIFPIEINSLSFTLKPLEDAPYPKYPHHNLLIPAHIQNEYVHLNTLDEDFFEYMQALDMSLVEQFTLIYDVNLNFVRNINNHLSYLNLNIGPLTKSEQQLIKEYDLLYTNTTHETDLELTLILDNYHRIPFNILNRLGLPYDDYLSFEALTDTVFYYIDHDTLYEPIGANQFQIKLLNDIPLASYKSVAITSILRQKEGYDFFSINPGIYLSYGDYQMLYQNNFNANITQAQLGLNHNVLTGLPFDDNHTKEAALKALGYIAYPTSYRISAQSIEAKKLIKTYISQYDKNTVIPLDKAELGLAIAHNAFDFFSLLGAGFILISLITSSAMIALSTYTSIIERTQEIGILKTLGVSNLDLTQSFGMELLMIGAASSLLTFFSYMVFVPIINSYLYNLLSIQNIFTFNFLFIFLFLLLSILFILMIGLMPLFIQNKKQAIESIKFNF